MSKFLNKKEFDNKIKQNIEYWKNSKRWKYIRVVIDELRKINPETSLEIGTEGIPLISTSDIFPYDAMQTPWSYKTRQYDCLVALQVLEHLQPKTKEAFQEMCRVAEYTIISLPYKWKRTKLKSHKGIDDKVIKKWTSGKKPYKKIIVGKKRRIILCYKNKSL